MTQTQSFSLSLLLPLRLSFLFLLSSAYTPPDKYFINCGSDSNVSFGLNRIFTGDVKPGSLPINPGKSRVLKDDTISKSVPEIYHTARLYNRPTWYVFQNINQNGTYVVRLHFFPLSLDTYPDLPKARFNVWASSGYQLLSNFSLQNNLEKKPVVEEFAFELKEGPFGIHFSPSVESPLAFVNAIEVFPVPEEFKPNSSYPWSPEVRTDETNKYELVSKAFQTIYRINVGGSLVTPDKDTLWRTWMPDDGFLVVPASAKNITFTGNIKYGEMITEYTAPTFVYNSAKELNMDTINGEPKFPNMTWVFKVTKKTKYFVRFHWCDFDNPATFLFDLFIDSNGTSFDSNEDPNIQFARPFLLEMVVFSDNSGFLKIGVARNDTSQLPRAFLNGLEIMELVEKSPSGPILKLEENKPHHQLLIGALVGGIVSIALVIGLLLFYCRVMKLKKSRQRLYQEFLSQDKQSEKISITDLAPNLKLDLKISFEEIKTATNDFDDKKLIGIGGFGKVYQGTLRDEEVAVKRNRSGFGQGLSEFQTEIIVLSEIRYRHLVTLYGYCDENEEMILVYEFMEMGTLRHYLYGSKTDYHPSLSWKQRLEICIDAAKGLDYLHTGSARGVIIHMDVKTTNILLDKNLMAKVADFGISKFGVPDKKESDTTIKGTYGYLDPECFNTGQFTEKSDVYSFGVVLFEVLSARAPIEKSLPSEEINLVEWAILCNSRGEVDKLIDPFLIGTIEPNSLRKFIEIAEKCVNEVGAKRPSMRDVVYDLQLALEFQYAATNAGKAFDGSTITDAQWDIPSTILDRIPSVGLDDSTIIENDSTTINARELAKQFKIDCAR